MHVEADPFEFHGVDTNVNQDLHTTVQQQPERVPGRLSRDDDAGTGRVRGVAGGDYRDARSECPSAEHWIGYVAEGDDRPVEWRLDLCGQTRLARGFCCGRGDQRRGTGTGKATLQVGDRNLGGFQFGGVLRGPVAGEDHQDHRGEECRKNRRRIQAHIAECGDRQQRGEDEGTRLNPAAEPDDDAADEAADQHPRIDSLEPQVNPVQRGLRYATEQTGSQAADRGLAHLLVALTPGQVEHTGGGTEAGEVPCAHRALDVVVAQGLNVEQHDGVDRPVQSQRHHERVREWDQDREDQW